MTREKLNFESYGDTILLEHEELITSNVSEVYKLSLPEEKKRKIVEKYVESLRILSEYHSGIVESYMNDSDLYLIKYNEKFLEKEKEESRWYKYPANLYGDSCLEDSILSMSFAKNWSDCLEELLSREGICGDRGSLISKSNNLKNQIWLLPSEMMIFEEEDYYNYYKKIE